MTLDKFILLLVGVMTAAGVTVWLVSNLVSKVHSPVFGWGVVIPIVLVAYVLLRTSSTKRTNREETHHDDRD